MLQKQLVFTVNQLKDFITFEAKRQQIKDVLAAAFDNDDFTTVLVNNDREFIGNFWVSTVIAGILRGEVYLAENEEGAVIGVSVWFPPGGALYDSKDQQEQALSILTARFAPTGFWKWWETEFLPNYNNLTTDAFGEGVKLASWHLQMLAVYPHYQRKAIGRVLVEVIKRKAANDNASMVTEVGKESNVIIYEKLGFMSTAPPSMFKGPAGGFRMWAMINGASDFRPKN